MITQQMLTESGRAHALEGFRAYVSGSKIPIVTDILLDEAVSRRIYGPVVASNLELMRQDEVDPDLALRAAKTLANLTVRSEAFYKDDSDNYRPPNNYYTHDFQDALRVLQAKMANGGKIQGAALPVELAMTKSEGIEQVTAANTRLNEEDSEVARLLADNNYSLYFTDSTMASASDTRLEDVIESESYEAMPHLSRSNYVVGQLAGHIVKHAQGRVSIIDTGSGSAATLARTIEGISDVTDFEGVSLSSVESNAGYHARLKDFTIDAMLKITGITPGFRFESSSSRDLSEMLNSFSLNHEDIADYFTNLKGLPNSSHDINLVTANFVWHRLPTKIKERIIGKVDHLSSNSIFLIGDLRQNGSDLNRRYFNFGNNGPLNCGNMDLEHILAKYGYQTIKLGRDELPIQIHPKLLESISQGEADDTHFWVAYKGEEAERVILAA